MTPNKAQGTGGEWLVYDDERDEQLLNAEAGTRPPHEWHKGGSADDRNASETGREAEVSDDKPSGLTALPGDSVFHVPSQETWSVAYVDARRDELAWLGWPPGTARASECVVTSRASESERRQIVAECWNLTTDRGSTDHRQIGVRRLYPELAPPPAEQEGGK